MAMSRCTEHVARRLSLGIFRAGAPVHLYIHCEEHVFIALGCQVWEDVEVPALIMARDLTATEAALSKVERLIAITHAFCHKFQGVILSAPVTCFLPDRA